MTFSPIINAAGTIPDPAAADPAGAAGADRAAMADPAATVPHPVVAPAAGVGRGQPAKVAAEASHTGAETGQAAAATGQADSTASYPGYADHGGYATSRAGTAAEHGGYATGQAGTAAEHGGYATGQAGAAAEHEGYATGQAGAAAEHEGYAAGQGDYSTDAADSGQQDDAEATWPHQTFLELGALATAAPCARLHTTLVLWEWELGTLVSTAGLVVSELVSNAVQASGGLTGSRFAGVWSPGTPPVRVWLSADDCRVVIQVWDGSDRPPVPQPVEPEEDRGRGLLLVGALSAEWGCYTPEKSSGKVVWAVVTG